MSKNAFTENFEHVGTHAQMGSVKDHRAHHMSEATVVGAPA
jgi:hypothetical protein